MPGPRSQIPIGKLYGYCQIISWGFFLVLRLLLTAVYLQAKPTPAIVAGCLLEAISHLAAAVWSHFIWRHLNRRRLLDRGWKRLVGEGLPLAYLGSVAILGLTWPSSQVVYSDDFARFGDQSVFWATMAQNLMITLIWFWPQVALLYFDRVRRLEVEHAEAHAVAREAQLHALRGQVNPHFLFNSFNSLRALVAIDPARATETITQLASILRYSLASSDRLVVPLAEELLIVQRYLDLEKLRLGSRLEIVASLPVDTDSAVLPPMLLQGLIENAVKFGPAARKAGGLIHYSVELNDHRLRLRVTNPGRLASSESTGLGLRNLRDRLRLLYGDAATFTLREDSSEQVIAEAEFPARPTDEALGLGRTNS